MSKVWITELEGLRGLAALWVFCVHISILSGTHLPFVSWGALGVDLFILLSGFLMTHQSEQKSGPPSWLQRRTTIEFWCKRFFRIAPLYYLLLACSFWMNPLLELSRSAIGRYYPTSATDSLRYTDSSWSNLFAHLSFIFGFIPAYSFRTALPDWSIGLEMQFYLFFPLLMLLVLKFGYSWMAFLSLLLCILGRLVFAGYYQSFPMTTFLPLKLNLFILGMLIAAALHKRLRGISLYVVGLPLVSFIILPFKTKLGVLADVILAILLLLVVETNDSKRLGMSLVRLVLNAKPTQWLGDISYSFYLVHLLVIMPICAALLHYQWVRSLVPIARYFLLFAVNIIFVLPVSAACHHAIEKPGMKFGKLVLAKVVTPNRQPASALKNKLQDQATKS